MNRNRKDSFTRQKPLPPTAIPAICRHVVVAAPAVMLVPPPVDVYLSSYFLYQFLGSVEVTCKAEGRVRLRVADADRQHEYTE